MVKSTKRGYKRFDPSVKQEAFALFDKGVNGKEVARRLGVSYPTIVNWKREQRENNPVVERPAVGGDVETQLLRLENEYLKKQLETSDETERLRLENEYLKKRLAVYEG